MNAKSQSPVMDSLKLLALIVAIGLLLFDVFYVRRRSRALTSGYEYQLSEVRSKLEDSESRVKELAETSRNQNSAAEFAAVAKAVKDARSAHQKELADLKSAHQKEIADLKSSHQAELANLKAQFERRLLDMKKTGGRGRDGGAMVRCGRCSGSGMVQMKVQCSRCGGKGKVKHGLRYTDCPSCLPGGMKGGGSKGYNLEKRTCPTCKGKGKVPQD